MDEISLIKKIEDVAGKEFLGDDCAYLKKFGITISQDSLVENIHFRRRWYTPYQLGYKAVIVNISDIIASGAKPEYVTIALSLPKNLCDGWKDDLSLISPEVFIQEFYEGAKAGLGDVKIAGGDITGSDTDIMISITAIGSAKNRRISSRSNAKKGYAVIAAGYFGSSACGLESLLNEDYDNPLIKEHLEPKLEYDFSDYISKNIKTDYAMMDTSDGLADALFKIAEASGIKISVDYEKIPHLPFIKREHVLFGGEDYKLVAVVPQKFAEKIPRAVILGNVYEYDGVRLDISGDFYNKYSDLPIFSHFV